MLSTADLLKRVRRIEIRTRGLSNHIFAGEYHSAFKGRGMSFSEVREYTPGDDVRTIDWNVTARLRTPYVKVFEEERELTVMLVVDGSSSTLFGTQQRLKQELITEICAVLAFSASTNNDKVGILIFDDAVRLYIPPKKGRSHVLRIIRELVAWEPQQGRATRLAAALDFLNSVLRKRTISFILSDFISAPYLRGLQLAARRHDLVCVQVTDPQDAALPDAGLLQIADAETGHRQWIDTSNKKARAAFAAQFAQAAEATRLQCLKSGARYLGVRTNEDYIRALQGFFKK